MLTRHRALGTIPSNNKKRKLTKIVFSQFRKKHSGFDEEIG